MKTQAKVLFTLVAMLLLACILVACTPTDTPPKQTTAQTTAAGGNNTPSGTPGGDTTGENTPGNQTPGGNPNGNGTGDGNSSGNNTPSGTPGGTQTPTLSECEKNGHNVVTDQAVAATCSKTGLTEGKHCSVCHEVIVAQTEIPIDPDAHTEVVDQAVAATCQSTGLTEGKHCSGCNAVIVAQTETPKLDYHTYQNGICTGCKDLQTKGLAYTLVGNSYYAVSGIGTCTDTEIYIPAEYQGLPVKSIGSRAFYDCSSLTSVTIGSGVTSIGERAFYDCESLKSVHITDLAQWCQISFCDWYSNPLRCAHNLYLNGTLVTELVIPDSITSIGDYAFYGCNMTSIMIPDSVTSIGSYAFSRCSSLKSITIPDRVTSIGNSAFRSCSSLTSITFSGTQRQWNAIKKDSDWNSGCSAKVVCTG